MSDQAQVSKRKTIALVLNLDFGEQVEALAQKMPVWIVESQINTEAVNRIRQCSQGFFEVTIFFRRSGESERNQFMRALYGLDEHQGNASTPNGYDSLLIYSVSPSEIDLQVLKELGFGVVEQTGFGWSAYRKHKTQRS